MQAPRIRCGTPSSREDLRRLGTQLQLKCSAAFHTYVQYAGTVNSEDTAFYVSGLPPQQIYFIRAQNHCQHIT